MENVLSEINKIAAEIFKKPNLKLKITDSLLEIDRWDSLTHVIFISAIEDCFSIEFSFRDLASIRTLKDLVNIIQNKINNLQT